MPYFSKSTLITAVFCLLFIGLTIYYYKFKASNIQYQSCVLQLNTQQAFWKDQISRKEAEQLKAEKEAEQLIKKAKQQSEATMNENISNKCEGAMKYLIKRGQEI